jgi:hypothetical protein
MNFINWFKTKEAQMPILQAILSFASTHSDLIKQIEALALNELISLLKQMSPTHPLFAQVALTIVDKVEELQGITPLQ